MLSAGRCSPRAEAHLQEAGFNIIQSSPAPDRPELVELLSAHQPDGLILRVGTIDRACFDVHPGLKAIANHGAGYDDIDVAEATRRGIPVFAAPGMNAISVAEHVFALLLAVRKRVVFHDSLIRRGCRRSSTPDMAELYGRIMGIVGIGLIGERVAHLAKAFEMEVCAFDLGRMKAFPEGVSKCEALPDLLSHSDVVSLHVPVTADTWQLIDRAALATMKPGAILINTARGSVVSETDLVAAIEAGNLYGTALDTFETEPPGAHAAVARNDRIVLSPHIGGVTPESSLRMSMCCASNIVDYLVSARKPRVFR